MVFQHNNPLKEFEKEIDNIDIKHEKLLSSLSNQSVWNKVLKPYIKEVMDRCNNFRFNIANRDTTADIGVKTLMAKSVYHEMEYIIDLVEGAEEAINEKTTREQ